MQCLIGLLLRWDPLMRFITLIAVIAYVVTTWFMARATSKAARASEKSIDEMRLAREEHSKPKVVCYFDHHTRKRQIYDLVIKNCGNSAAFNVKLVFSPQLERYGARRLPALKEIRFRVMAPGYEWRTFWDSFPGTDISKTPDEFVANVTFDWDRGRRHEAYDTDFDVKSLIGYWIGETSVEDSLQEIAKAIQAKPDEDSLLAVAESVKNVASALEKQGKARRYRHA